MLMELGLVLEGKRGDWGSPKDRYADGNIWTWKRSTDKGLEKIAQLGAFAVCTVDTVLY